MLGGGGLTWHKDDAKNLLGAAWAGGGVAGDDFRAGEIPSLLRCEGVVRYGDMMQDGM
jgi:hypothetical protein